MAKVYKSLCREIDDVSLQVLHLTQKLTIYKVKMEKIMEHGYVNIAKARYIMGSRCVSALQLPTEDSEDIIPISTICRAEHEGHFIFKLHKKSLKPPSRDESMIKEFGIDTTRPDVIIEKRISETSSIKPTAIVEDLDYKDFKGKINRGSVDVESVTIGNLADPVSWFGVLVPYTLRMAQKSFTEALEIATNIATIQSELLTSMEHYKHLWEVKTIVELSTAPLGLDIYFDRGYGSVRIASELLIPEESLVAESLISTQTKISVAGEAEEEQSFIPCYPVGEEELPFSEFVGEANDFDVDDYIYDSMINYTISDTEESESAKSLITKPRTSNVTIRKENVNSEEEGEAITEITDTDKLLEGQTVEE